VCWALGGVSGECRMGWWGGPGAGGGLGVGGGVWVGKGVGRSDLGGGVARGVGEC